MIFYRKHSIHLGFYLYIDFCVSHMKDVTLVCWSSFQEQSKRYVFCVACLIKNLNIATISVKLSPGHP